MGFIDRFLNAIKLNDDFDDDDFLDDEEDLDDYDDDSYDKPKTRKRFFSKFGSADDEDDFDDNDDDEADEEPVTPRRASASRAKSSTGKKESRKSPSGSYRSADEDSSSARRTARSSYGSSHSGSGYSYGSGSASSASSGSGRKQKVTPIRKRSAAAAGSGMEVSVIRPSSMEDTREIADTLMNGCTVILNLEGLDVDIAQRVIDFSCGVCYSLEGRLQKVASYIFILTPADVDISGDFQSILTGAFDLSAMQTNY